MLLFRLARKPGTRMARIGLMARMLLKMKPRYQRLSVSSVYDKCYNRARMKRWIAITGLCLILAACAGQKWAASPTLALPTVTPWPAETLDVAQSDAFVTAVPVGDMNTAMTLELTTAQPGDLKVGSVVELCVENQTDQAIWFPVDYGNRLLTYSAQDRSWMEVGNRVTYHVYKDVILDAKGGDFDRHTIAVWPDISNTGKPIDIRVVVIGKIYNGGALTDRQVGAYVDVTLQP